MHLLFAREELPSEADHRANESLDPHIERDRDRRGCHRSYDKRGPAHTARSASLLDNEPCIGQLGDEHAYRASV